MRIPKESRSQDPLKAATITTLERVIDPLVDLMFDAGITVHEFSRLVRERAVRIASARIARESGRTSNSRVAITTGLARGEVARILNAEEVAASGLAGQHPARKVLAAWYDNSQFLGPNGDPAVLPIFGKRKSFERLVGMYSGGIPVRAMLDELAQINAVEILPRQRIRPKARVPTFRGMTTSAISNVGERAADLLATLTRNLRTSSNALFEATALMSNVDASAVALVRRDIAEQGAAFIDGATSLLTRSRARPGRTSANKSPQCRVGVTVYYFEDSLPTDAGNIILAADEHRKNLHRRNRKRGIWK
jgi:hypothetical protein